MKPTFLIGLLVMGAFALPGVSVAQTAVPVSFTSADCPAADASGSVQPAHTALPNLARALEQRRKIKILTIGATNSNARAPDRDYTNLIKAYLDTSIKGLETKIIDHGTSGELADEGSRRIRLLVSIKKPDLVLWQVGTFDAMAQVSPADFEHTLLRTAKWLRKQNVDLVLVGMHYLRDMAGNENYQVFRSIIKNVALREGITRIGRYEAVETIERARLKANKPVDSFELTETGYGCMANMVARSIATSLFAKQ